MADPPEDLSPYARGIEWVARITTVALEMVLPGLAGQWVDRRFGTNFFVLVGFALGITTGIWHLIAMTKERRTGSPKDEDRDASDRGNDNR